jgi:hypothetical protein
MIEHIGPAQVASHHQQRLTARLLSLREQTILPTSGPLFGLFVAAGLILLLTWSPRFLAYCCCWRCSPVSSLRDAR